MQTGGIKFTRFGDNQGIPTFHMKTIIALHNLLIKIAQASNIMIFEIRNLVVERLRNTITMSRHLFL